MWEFFWLILLTVLFLWIYIGEEGFDDVYWGYTAWFGCIYVAQIAFIVYQFIVNGNVVNQELFTTEDKIKTYEAYRGITYVFLLVLMFYPLRAQSFLGELIIDESNWWPLVAIGVGIYVHMCYWSYVFLTRMCYLCQRRQLLRTHEQAMQRLEFINYDQL